MLIGDVAVESINYSSIIWKLQHEERARLVFASAALSYHIEYILNFIVTENVNEVHFAVLDVARRLAIILAGAVLFGKVLSPLNIFGVVLALFGVLCFNRVRRKELVAGSPDGKAKSS